MSSSSPEEVVGKSPGWWVYAAPLAVALLLFLLVGTIFETRIEGALRGFVERQRQRLFTQTNERQATTEPTNQTPPPPAKNTVEPIIPKFTPAQTIVSFNNKDPIKLDSNKIQVYNEDIAASTDVNSEPKIDDTNFNISHKFFDTEIKKENETDRDVLIEENNDYGVKIHHHKKNVVIKEPYVDESDLDVTSAYTSMSVESKSVKSTEKIDKILGKKSFSGNSLNKLSHYVCKRPEECCNNKEANGHIENIASDTRYRQRSELALPASNLYS